MPGETCLTQLSQQRLFLRTSTALLHCPHVRSLPETLPKGGILVHRSHRVEISLSETEENQTPHLTTCVLSLGCSEREAPMLFTRC